MKVRKISITKQIVFRIAALILIGDFIIGAVIYNNIVKQYMSQIQTSASNLAMCVASSVDSETFTQIEDGNSEEFKLVKEQLNFYRENTNLEYVYTFKLDESGNPIFVVDTDPEDAADFGQPYGQMLDGMKLAFEGETAADSEATSDEWGKYISAYSPIFKDGKVVGIVGVDMNFKEVMTSIDKLLQMLVLIFVLVFILLFVSIYFISRKMKKGFVTLNSKVNELADGSGDLNKKITINSGDEFEVVSESINNFISQLSNLVNQVAESTNSNAEGIRAINNNTIEISANMEECSASTENVSIQLENTATNVEQLAFEIDAVSQSVLQASERAQKAAELAINHKAESEEQISKIQQDIAHVMEQAKAVEQVKKINEQIIEVVNQTRILSINAQIEAARAGEFGRGFAVVAKQVAELSEGIQVSVVDIEEINDQVLEAMTQMVKYLENMTNYLNESVSADYEAFAEIGQDYGDTTESIQEQMQALKGQSAEIAATVTGVSNSINDISRAVSDSAEQIEELCNSTVDMSDGIDRLLEIEILKCK